MGYYDNILNLFSLVLVLAIFFIILFGCQFKSYRKIEKFSTKELQKETQIEVDDDEEKENTEEKKDKPLKANDVKKEKDEDKIPDGLEGFEGQILEGLTSGSITSTDMDKFINAGTFTRENLENIISYVEKFKNQFS